jgi:hypothetical protein
MPPFSAGDGLAHRKSEDALPCAFRPGPSQSNVPCGRDWFHSRAGWWLQPGLTAATTATHIHPHRRATARIHDCGNIEDHVVGVLPCVAGRLPVAPILQMAVVPSAGQRPTPPMRRGEIRPVCFLPRFRMPAPSPLKSRSIVSPPMNDRIRTSSTSKPLRRWN